MAQQMKELYEFGSFTLDVAEGRLLLNGQPVPLKPKVIETLLVLVENCGRTTDKEELMKRLWPDSFVEEANLAVNISQLRKALGESGERYVETVPKRGYRFNAQVTRVLADPVDMVVRERTRARVVIDEVETDREAAIGAIPDAAATLLPAVQRQSVLSWIGEHQKLMIAIVMLLGIGTATLAFILLRPKAPRTFQLTNRTKLTNLGKVTRASISRDGKYVAYVVKDGRKQALWVHHIATSQDVEVISPAERNYWAVNFTPDGNFIDYNLIAEEALYRVGVLGGPSTKIIEHISNDVAYSPDGGRLAFIRNDDQIVEANADGTSQKVIATRKIPDHFGYFPSSLAWSPDGMTIAAVATRESPEGMHANLVEINPQTGTERLLTSRRWDLILGVAWLRDGGGILLSASDETSDNTQIWRLSYPDGELRRVTDDLNSHLTLSSTQDSAAIITVQQTPISTLWIAPNGDIPKATQISSNTTEGTWGLCWTPDRRIVYTSKASGAWDLWIMNSDGTGRKQLTTNAKTNELPAVTPDGRWIVFSSNRSGNWAIWRMGLNGENPQRLTNVTKWVFASSSADSKWILYEDWILHEDQFGGKSGIFKVSIDGGEPAPVINARDWNPFLRSSTSPDGQWIALTYFPSHYGGPFKLGVVSLEEGKLVKSFDLPADIQYDCIPRWTADSKAITYARYGSGSMIWIQPLDGSPARELGDFKSDGILDFAWSPDGKQLLAARGGRFGDVVMISNLH